MIIAVASGKGGTGKTTVATNLAVSAGREMTLVDCDVEEPNSHIFLKPEIFTRKRVTIPVPKVDLDTCNGCGECGTFCEFNAIVYMNNQILFYSDLCHGCGGCTLVCPEKAITEIDRDIGVIEFGKAGPVKFIHGKMNVGEALATPVIRAVKRDIPGDGLTVIDAPPGTSCPVIESIRGSDYVILVAEPSLFGLNDLDLTVQMMRKIDLSFGIVLNRSVEGNRIIHDYCLEQKIPMLLEIPEDRAIAEAYSRGYIAAEQFPELKKQFAGLLDRIEHSVNERVRNFRHGLTA